MEKLAKKIIFLTLTIFIILIIINNDAVFATQYSSEIQDIGIGTEPRVGTNNGIIKITKNVLGLVRMVAGLFSIVIIAYTGFEFVTETPEGKKKVKEKMIPIIIGFLLTFTATSLATFIVGLVDK